MQKEGYPRPEDKGKAPRDADDLQGRARQLAERIVEVSHGAMEFQRKTGKTPDEQVRARVFHPMYATLVVPQDELRAVQGPISGFFIGDDGSMQVSRIGDRPLELREVGFFYVQKPVDFADRAMQHIFSTEGDRVLVPILGDFFVSDRKLTDDELKKMRKERLVDDSGKPVTYPVLLESSRKCLLAAYGSIPFLNIGGERYFLGSVNEMSVALDKAFGSESGSKVLWREVDDMIGSRGGELDEAYRDHVGEGGKLSKAEYVQERKDALFHAAGRNALALLSQSRSDMKIEDEPIVGFDLKGLGIDSYESHSVQADESGRVPVAPGEKLLGSPKDSGRLEDRITNWGHVVVLALKGKRGIFLATPYQPHNRTPVGGDSASEAECMKRQRKILKNRGRVAGITFSSIPVFLANELKEGVGEELCHPAIAVNVRAQIRDNRRLSMFFDQYGRVNQNSHRMYQAFIKEKYGAGGHHRHLSMLSANLGLNTHAILASGYTIPHNQRHEGNLNVDGWVTDETALGLLRHKRQAYSTIMHHIRILDAVSRISGMEYGEYFKSDYFRDFLTNFIGEDRGNQLFTNLSKEVNQIDFMGDPGHMKISGVITDAWLESQGAGEASVWQMDDRRVLDYLDANPALRKAARISNRSLSEVRRVSLAGKHADYTMFHNRVNFLRAGIELAARFQMCPSIQDAADEVMFPERPVKEKHLDFQTPQEFVDAKITLEPSGYSVKPAKRDFSEVRVEHVASVLVGDAELTGKVVGKDRNALQNWAGLHLIGDSDFLIRRGVSKREDIQIMVDNIAMYKPEAADEIERLSGAV
jgi:hypothetical protein